MFSQPVKEYVSLANETECNKLTFYNIPETVLVSKIQGRMLELTLCSQPMKECASLTNETECNKLTFYNIPGTVLVSETQGKMLELT